MSSLNNPKKLELKFRASEHGFKSQAFHQKCDGILNTLTVVKTEFGKTIAGFTHYPWNKVVNNSVNDVGKKAFLLSLDLKQKMVAVSSNCLIYCHSEYGPTFGAGRDLKIGDQCHINRCSYSNFPTTYNYAG